MTSHTSPLDQFIVRFTKGVIRFRWAVVAAVILLTALIGKNSTGLFFDTDYRAFFSDENPQVQAFDELQEVYTKNDNILFVVAPQNETVFSAAALDAVSG